ncbi:unnamed protein product [Sphagnum balticum]
MGGRSNVAEPQRQGHVEEDNIAAASLSSHQPIRRGQERPVTTMTSEAKQTQCGGGESSQLQPQAVFGYCLMPGLRGIPMEDFHVAEVREIDGEEVGMFAIYDSHGGDAVARYLQENLFRNILHGGGVGSDPAGATRDAYLLTDRKILESVIGRGGSTAVTALLSENGGRLIVANVGDSRAVLSKDGKAVQVSVDHDPGRPVERANVEARGGIVTHMPGDSWRVDGQLSIARAFGDKVLKEHMSAKPDVADLVVDLSCEALILGSNGLWSVFDNQEVVDIVRSVGDPAKAAHDLVHEARHRFSEDDISCVVIEFHEV